VSLSKHLNQGISFVYAKISRCRFASAEWRSVFFASWASILVHFLLLFGLSLFAPKFDSTVDSLMDRSTFESLPTQVLTLDQFNKAYPNSKMQPSTQRVVETDLAKSSVSIKERAKYLSEQTQRVERETVASEFGTVRGASSAAPKISKNAENTNTDSSSNNSHRAMNLGFGKVFPDSKNTTTQRLNQGEVGKSYGSHDVLDSNIAVSTQTLLNTDEYIYASFFNRLKSEVAARWEPMVSRVVNSSNHRIGQGVYKTQALLVVANSGEVLRVDIVRGSGIGAFDEAARSAGLQLIQVQNLPSALREPDGLYRIELGFVVNLQRSGIQMEYVPDRRLLQR